MGCGRASQEEATLYYEHFSDIMIPYTEETERVLTETQTLLRRQLNNTGHLRLSPRDSVRQYTLLTGLETKARSTVAALTDLEDFRGSNLKSSGIDYVEESLDAILTIHRALAETSHAEARTDLREIESLTNSFSEQLIELNERFGASQMEFLQEFDLLTH